MLKEYVRNKKNPDGNFFPVGGSFCLTMAKATGLEPVTAGLEIRCSIQLSYASNQIPFTIND